MIFGTMSSSGTIVDWCNGGRVDWNVVSGCANYSSLGLLYDISHGIGLGGQMSTVGSVTVSIGYVIDSVRLSVGSNI